MSTTQRSKSDGITGALVPPVEPPVVEPQVDEEELVAAIANATGVDVPAPAEAIIATMTQEPEEDERFRGHSDARIRRLQEEEANIAKQAANLRYRINELEEEYTDLMLSASGIAADIAAIEHNRAKRAEK